MAIADREGRVLQANRALLQSSGYTEEEIRGRHVSEFGHPDDVALSEPLRKRLVRGEIPGYTLEKRYLGKDGQVVWARVTTAAARDAEGNVTHVMAVLEDITARKQAEAALHASELKYRRLLEHMPDFVVVVDRDAKILYANRPAPGAPVPELVGSTGFDHIVPEHRGTCQAAFQRALATGEVQLVELLDLYGTWFRSRVVPLPDGEAEAKAMVISADITQRKCAEAATHEKQRLLQQALEVYEQHRQLAAYEIHDGLVQPLAAALMNVDASLRHLDAQRLDAARDGLARTRQLMQDTISQARRLMNGLRPPVLDESGILPAIDHLVYEHQSAGIIAVQYTPNVQFTRLAPPLETALFRIIQEGLANAERHSQSGTVRLALIQQGDRIRVEVEDWGVGFDPARVEQGRFGLKGVRERAQLFGGSATIHSAPGQGTRITVELPLVEAVPKAAWDAT
jgi:PAS domain S-box-containing protein